MGLAVYQEAAAAADPFAAVVVKAHRPLASADQLFVELVESFQKGDVRRCLKGSDPAACERALDEAEVLKRRTAARSANPCHALLLGLQADLIMQQLGQGRGEQALTDLGRAFRGCAEL